MINQFMEKVAKQKELTEENFKEETMKFPKKMNGLTGGMVGSMVGSMVGIPAGGALFYKTNKVAPAVLAPVGAALAGNLIGRSLPVNKKYRQAVDAMTPEEIKEQIEWTNKIYKGYTPTEDEKNYMPPLARHLYNQEKAAAEVINEGLYKIAQSKRKL